MEPLSEIPEELIPCSNCGRTFIEASLERHFKICSKTKILQQHRQKFDSSKQRIQGTELEQYIPTPIKKSASRPRSRSVPTVPGGGRRGSSSSLNHELCQYCGRSFGEKAIDRHREWCQSQNVLKQHQPVNLNTAAYERMQARTQYRAPLTKTMRARTREKYSPMPVGITLHKDVTNLTKSVLLKRASLPETRRSREMRERQPSPPKQEKQSYDVFESAERQLKELGLLDCPDSPILLRRGSSLSVNDMTPSYSSPSSVSLHRSLSKSSSSTSASNSTELLIIEDEEEYLINKLAEESAEQKIKTPDNQETEHVYNTGELNVDNESLLEVKKDDELINKNIMKSDSNEYKKDDIISSSSSSSLNSNFKELEFSDEKQENGNEFDNNLNPELFDNISNNTAATEAEIFFNSLKQSLERPDVTKDRECPLTESLKYLDAALSLFSLDDIPTRPSDAPRSKASTKRRLYSAASPLSLLGSDPSLLPHEPPVLDVKCSECGSPFPVPSARFCCLCGTKRVI